MKLSNWSSWLICLTLACFSNFPRASSTVCDTIYSGEKWIQGVVAIGPDKSIIFINDYVYEFNPSASGDSIILENPGTHVERYFEGVYLKGARIYNVYALFMKQSPMIFFMLTADDPHLLNEIHGFSYDVENRRSYQVENGVHSPNFPFVFFGNSQDKVISYQVPNFSMGRPLGMNSKFEPIGLMEFNIFEREFEYKIYNSSGISKDEFFRQRLLLKSAFYNRPQSNKPRIVLVSDKAVFIVDEEDFSKNTNPAIKKIPLKEYIKCGLAAVELPVNWGLILTIVLSVLLLIIIIGLMYAITASNSEKSDEAEQATPGTSTAARSSSPTEKSDKKSNTTKKSTGPTTTGK